MRKFSIQITAEIFYWFAMPVVFLSLYIFKYYNPETAVIRHLYPLSLIFSSIFLLKIILFKIFIENKWTQFAIVFFYSTTQYSLFLYYLLVLIGLHSWGKVITTEIFTSYLNQITHFLDAIGISIFLMIIFTLALYLVFVFLTYYLIKNKYFLNTIFNKKISWKIQLFAYLILLIACLIPIHHYFFIRAFIGNEPFHLTMYAGKDNAVDTLEHPIKFNIQRTAYENTIRNGYLSVNNNEQRNVILIVVDALRPDHMGIYGYNRDTTPYLKKLDDLGVVTKFNNARAACGASACGLSTLATARFAHEIPDNPLTLSQALAANNYTTQIILSGDHTNFYNLRNLYGKVDNYYDGSLASGYYMNDDALIINKIKELDSFKGNPTFFQFHLMSAHGLSKHLPVLERYKPNKGYSGNIRGKPSLEHINYYDNGVIQADFYINQILKALEKKNYLNDALIIITADHGESLGEQNMYSHANSVYESLLRIPFVAINFKKDKKILDHNKSLFVSQADIAPTILFELGLQIPSNWTGKAVQLQHDSYRKSSFTYFQLHPRVGAYIHGENDQLFKYWINTYNSEEFLYQILTDPIEQNNLISELDPNERSKLRELIQGTRTD